MGSKMVDVTMHIDESITHNDREKLRDQILHTDGVIAAVSHDDKPHLMVIEFDPDMTNTSQFKKIAQESGLHVELIGL